MTLEVELSMNIYSSQLFSFNAYFFNTIYKEMTTFNGNRFQFRISNLFKHYAGSFYRVFNFIFLYNTLFLWKKNLATFILLCLSWNISVKFLSPSTWRTKSVCLHYVSHPCFLFFIINFLVFIFPLLIILHTCSNWRENNTEGFHCIRTTSNCEITL